MVTALSISVRKQKNAALMMVLCEISRQMHTNTHQIFFYEHEGRRQAREHKIYENFEQR